MQGAPVAFVCQGSTDDSALPFGNFQKTPQPRIFQCHVLEEVSIFFVELCSLQNIRPLYMAAELGVIFPSSLYRHFHDFCSQEVALKTLF